MVKYKTKDLRKKQTMLHETSVENSKQANEAIKYFQNWLLILWLAELAFLWARNLQLDNLSIIIKFEFWFLLIWFLCFLVWTLIQYHYIKSVARKYYSYSNDLSDFCTYLEKEEIEETNNIPKNLINEWIGIKTSNISNILLLFSFLSICISTILIGIEIIF